VDLSRRLDIVEISEGRLAISGEIDVATRDQLDARLADEAGSAMVSLDLAGVSFIDSSGLRVLIEHHQRFEEEGGQLELTELSAPAARLIEVAGLDQHLHLS
jgi:anti-sigma B factor antagonist